MLVFTKHFIFVIQIIKAEEVLSLNKKLCDKRQFSFKQKIKKSLRNCKPLKQISR